MQTTPKSLRLQIAIFGRANVGKSSFLNLISGQDAAITSPVPGTTTDVVEKPMELRPVGPVLLLDTAGLDDPGELGALRVARTRKVFDRADVAVLVTTAGVWGEAEENILAEAKKREIPVIIAVNQTDREAPSPEFLDQLRALAPEVIELVCAPGADREAALAVFKPALWRVLPESFVAPPPLLGDLVKPHSLVLMIVPVDLQAPKGRLILPQVQAIRDVLDHDAMCLAVKENEYPDLIGTLRPAPELVICDSQVVDLMVRHTPPEIPCTTFSILFARMKGDLAAFLAGSRAIAGLRDGDRVLIAEACTHHATCEDIGRVKIPRLLQAKTGKKLEFTFAPGRDFPAELADFRLIVHCGSCMLNRKETLWRIRMAQAANVPIVNYGMAISYCRGVLDRVTAIFRDRK